MNLQNLSDNELEQSTAASVRIENQAVTRVLHHLCEIQRRKLFSRRECDSLYSYCRKVLGYSEPESTYRVNAARAMQEFPQIEESIQSGLLSLTSISKAQSFFNQEAKHRNKPLSKDEKKEVLEKLQEKSTREAEMILFSISSAPEKLIKEKVTQVSEKITEARLPFDEETMQNLQRLKEVWSHSMPGASFADIIKRLAKEGREKHDPVQKAERSNERQRKKNDFSFKQRRDLHHDNVKSGSKSSLTTEPDLKSNKTGSTMAPSLSLFNHNLSSAKPHSRAIPSAVRHAVWMRDGGVCRFTDPRTGQVCGTRHFLELDHVQPFALGGENRVENLRLRCRAHNARHAIQAYGAEFMNSKMHISQKLNQVQNR